MDMAEVERRLLGLDDEIHDLLRYISTSKERDIEVELENYEDMTETISRNLKEPLDPTAEIGKMREISPCLNQPCTTGKIPHL